MLWYYHHNLDNVSSNGSQIPKKYFHFANPHQKTDDADDYDNNSDDNAVLSLIIQFAIGCVRVCLANVPFELYHCLVKCSWFIPSSGRKLILLRRRRF
jgi:hypothetical protein